MSNPLTTLSLCTLLAITTMASLYAESETVQKIARFEYKGKVRYGLVKGESILAIEGDIFGEWKRSDYLMKLEDVKLLVPTEPKQIFAMAGNYKSHLDGEVPEQFKTPQPFLKAYSSLQRPDGEIQLPPESAPVHYEAEMVIVIGKEAKNVSKEDAKDYILGITCGNDVSARAWQKGDVQWWRAKASDTFSPCGPWIVTGLDYDDLLMTLKLNGKVVQEERTSLLLHDVASTVSFISQHTTLHPGDLIFTGTPGKTDVIKSGDVVEVEIEGVGVLRNTVVDE
ncbi:Ureidoglycolate lyase [Polystyrenella longa]|uniref:Ureidoglycolate lyase n=1 Tax=Polystyrenella longa TaxID=2528007 RepID=A0A518CI95_9PLAN|nr:fumarylacetoacetate hydrolase family protein [Polystyrenella longa]QDU78884.1 Ureidoglycolate lyase [Polystyrenella longa]